jgi:hypothetical protein
LAVITPAVDTQVRLVVVGTGGTVTLHAGGSNYWTSGEIEVVSGNAPVTGQSVDYAFAGLTANTSALSAAADLVVNNLKASSGVTLNTSTGVFTLPANKTFLLEADLSLPYGSPSQVSAWVTYQWVDGSGTAIPGGTTAQIITVEYTGNGNDGHTRAVAMISTGATTKQVKVRIVGASNAVVTTNSVIKIQQIGSSSVIAMIGASTVADGVGGTTTQSKIGDQNKFLKGDATWAWPLTVWTKRAYVAGERTFLPGYGLVIEANDAIADTVDFAWGTTGATWKPILPTGYTWRGVWASSTEYVDKDIVVHGSGMISPPMRVFGTFTSSASSSLVGDTRTTGATNVGKT